MASNCGGDNLAIELFDKLTEDYDVNLPEIDFNQDAFKLPPREGDLYDKINPITFEELTTKQIDGSGTFDGLMTAIDAHLDRQFDKNRITGKEYSETYIALTTAALNTGLQFLLGKDAAYWAAIQAQLQARRAEIEAVTAAVQMETTKANYGIAMAQLVGEEAKYALTKMQIATTDAQYCNILEEKNRIIAETNLAIYQHSDILPEQKASMISQREQTDYQTDTLLPAQKLKVDADTANVQYQTSQILPAQRSNVLAQTANTEFQTTNILPAQEDLLKEQFEAARAQTLGTRRDGTPVAGTVGAQVVLYQKQANAFDRDIEYKIAKLYMDQWIAQKSIDEGLSPPAAFTNPNIDAVFTTTRNRADM